MKEVGIDYLTVRVMTYSDPEEVIRFVLGLDVRDFKAGRGFNYYPNSLKYSNIVVCYGNIPQMGILINLSGQGCREYCIQQKDEYALYKLLRRLHENDRVTRLDIAFDDHDGALDLNLIAEKFARREYRGKVKIGKEIKSNNDYDGRTLYFGSRKSEYMVRIYDKAAEQEVDAKWIRVEEMLRQTTAENFVRYFLSQTNGEKTEKEEAELFNSLASGLLLKRLAFVEPTDTNISRCPICSWWENFLMGSAEVVLPKRHTAPSAERSKKWLENNVAQTFGAICLLYGTEWLMAYLDKSIVQNIFQNSKFDDFRHELSANGGKASFEIDDRTFKHFYEDLEASAERKCHRLLQ